MYGELTIRHRKIKDWSKVEKRLEEHLKPHDSMLPCPGPIDAQRSPWKEMLIYAADTGACNIHLFRRASNVTTVIVEVTMGGRGEVNEAWLALKPAWKWFHLRRLSNVQLKDSSNDKTVAEGRSSLRVDVFNAENFRLTAVAGAGIGAAYFSSAVTWPSQVAAGVAAFLAFCAGVSRRVRGRIKWE